MTSFDTPCVKETLDTCGHYGSISVCLSPQSDLKTFIDSKALGADCMDTQAYHGLHCLRMSNNPFSCDNCHMHYIKFSASAKEMP